MSDLYLLLVQGYRMKLEYGSKNPLHLRPDGEGYAFHYSAI